MFEQLKQDLEYIQANIDAIRKMLDDPNAKAVDIQAQAENLREAAMSIDLEE